MNSIIENTQKNSINKALTTLNEGVTAIEVAASKIERSDVLKKHTEQLAKLKELNQKVKDIMVDITIENDTTGYAKLAKELEKTA